MNKKKRIIIAGDFNYDLLTYTKNEKVNEFITRQHCILKPPRIVENQRPSIKKPQKYVITNLT